MIARLFPFLHDFSDYSLRDYKGDFLAALTLTPMAAPLAMAYAVIAGVPPQYGIYTCMLPVIVAALWGSSRFLAAGPTNATSLVLFSALGTVSVAGVPLLQLPEPVRMSIIFGIALFCGLIQIVMGLMRLGEIANYISHSVMSAFGASMALLIAAGQLTTVLGIAPPQSGGFFFQVANAAARLAELAINPWCLLPAVMTIVLILWLQSISRLFPATLAALAIAGITADIFDLAARGVPMIADIPDIVPPLSLPTAFDFDLVRNLLSPALALAILGGVQSLAIGKQLAGVRNDVFDGSRELIAQGLGNIAAGFTSGLPGCGSFTRSAPMIALGARTRMAAVFSGLLSLPLLYVLAPLISHVPMPALGGVLMLIAVQTLKPADIRFCLVATRTDRIVFIATFFATLTLDLTQAILLGVILSLGLFIYKAAHPRVHKMSASDPLLRPLPHGLPSGLAVYFIEGTLFFGAIHELERSLHSVEETPPRVLILHLSRVFWLDASGAHALEQFIERCHARSVPIILVCGCPQVRDILQRTGLVLPLKPSTRPSTLPVRSSSTFPVRRIAAISAAPRTQPPAPLPENPTHDRHSRPAPLSRPDARRPALFRRRSLACAAGGLQRPALPSALPPLRRGRLRDGNGQRQGPCLRQSRHRRSAPQPARGSAARGAALRRGSLFSGTRRRPPARLRLRLVRSQHGLFRSQGRQAGRRRGHAPRPGKRPRCGPRPHRRGRARPRGLQAPPRL